MKLFKLDNVSFEGSHAYIDGTHGKYSIYLGSGVIHKLGGHVINVLPVHSQNRGKIKEKQLGRQETMDKKFDVMWDDSLVDVSTEVNFIWSIANKLRGPYRSDKLWKIHGTRTSVRVLL